MRSVERNSGLILDQCRLKRNVERLAGVVAGSPVTFLVRNLFMKQISVVVGKTRWDFHDLKSIRY